MWFVYILRCQDDSLYTGISPDPEKRFTVHINGKGGNYTRSHKPVKIIYQEQCATKSDALKREVEIKRLTRKQKEDVISGK